MAFHMDDRHLESNNLLADEESLTLPHFDDEATVQSARPVVPLQELRKAWRSKRRIILGAALCLSAFVGAVAASLVYSNRGQQVEESVTATTPQSAQESSPGFIAPSGEASGAIVDPEEALAAD
ncbi:MAG TPA: hypothetical protein VFH15_09935, partial [Pyrinomonadaceae bacterium]|nr:hypothetical protein [Pyrinomonadaceae bacterium]